MTTLTYPPSARPSSACPPDASTPYGMPLSPAASSFADSPSTMKLFEKLRWLPIDSPPPGTADVSAKSCVLATLAGDTPGTSSARSRKLRPFIGSARTSVSDSVAAIWLRAVSSTAASAVTTTLASSPATASTSGTSNAEPTVSVSRRDASLNPSRCAAIS